jgi:hypothetical protein
VIAVVAPVVLVTLPLVFLLLVAGVVGGGVVVVAIAIAVALGVRLGIGVASGVLQPARLGRLLFIDVVPVVAVAGVDARRAVVHRGRSNVLRGTPA